MREKKRKRDKQERNNNMTITNMYVEEKEDRIPLYELTVGEEEVSRIMKLQTSTLSALITRYSIEQRYIWTCRSSLQLAVRQMVQLVMEGKE